MFIWDLSENVYLHKFPSCNDLATSHMLDLLCFHFYFCKDIFCYPFWFLFDPLIVQEHVVQIIHFSYYWFLVSLETILDIMSIFLNFLVIILWPNICSILENILWVLDTMYLLLVGWSVSCMSAGHVFIASCKKCMHIYLKTAALLTIKTLEC